MKLSIDTREDSHEDIKKIIRMLQNIVGESQEVFTNQPVSQDANNSSSSSPFANIFGEISSSSGTEQGQVPFAQESPAETQAAAEDKPEETAEEADEGSSNLSESTEDLFAELFSEEELKKMDVKKADEEEDEELEIKPKRKSYGIEFY